MFIKNHKNLIIKNQMEKDLVQEILIQMSIYSKNLNQMILNYKI